MTPREGIIWRIDVTKSRISLCERVGEWASDINEQMTMQGRKLCGNKGEMELAKWSKRPFPHLSLHHVDPLRAQLSDAVENVHHAFVLRHVQHDVHSDEAARSSSPSTAGETERGSYCRFAALYCSVRRYLWL